MSRAPSPLELAQHHAAAGRIDDAVALLMRHLRQSPRDVNATVSLSLMLVKQNNLERAEFYFSRAVELAPQIASIHSDHGHALMVLGRLKEAVARFCKALHIDPNLALAHTGLAQSLTQLEDLSGAIAAAEEGSRRCPKFPDLHDNLSRARLLSGDAPGAAAAARRGIELAPDNQRLLASLATALTYAPDAAPAEIAAAYAANGRAMAVRSAPAPAWPNTRDPDRPLRIGYLSSDLREHSIAYFIEPILANHDPAAARIFCYSTAQHSDDTAARLKSLVTSRGMSGGVWADLSRTTSDAIAARIRADQIDILIELGGHSLGNKLGVILHRPAPVIVTYMGWATTTGLPMVDWRIVDTLTDPPGYEPHSTERLARLDPCFLCYAGLRDAPDPSPRRPGPPVFGSFNAIPKINSICIRLWAAAMNATPDSRIIIKSAQFEHAHNKDRIASLFASHGIQASRLEFIPRLPDLKQHLQTYQRIDVALDTFPYNGTTTTCEALWMGVPVVTLQGNMHASRVSSSLLSAIGAADLIANNEQDFTALASSLALDHTRLNTLRSTLRTRMQSSPLCNGPAFTRRFESTLRALWQDFCRRSQS